MGMKQSIIICTTIIEKNSQGAKDNIEQDYFS